LAKTPTPPPVSALLKKQQEGLPLSAEEASILENRRQTRLARRRAARNKWRHYFSVVASGEIQGLTLREIAAQLNTSPPAIVAAKHRYPDLYAAEHDKAYLIIQNNLHRHLLEGQAEHIGKSFPAAARTITSTLTDENVPIQIRARTALGTVKTVLEHQRHSQAQSTLSESFWSDLDALDKQEEIPGELEGAPDAVEIPRRLPSHEEGQLEVQEAEVVPDSQRDPSGHGGRSQGHPNRELATQEEEGPEEADDPLEEGSLESFPDDLADWPPYEEN